MSVLKVMVIHCHMFGDKEVQGHSDFFLAVLSFSFLLMAVLSGYSFLRTYFSWMSLDFTNDSMYRSNEYKP